MGEHDSRDIAATRFVPRRRSAISCLGMASPHTYTDTLQTDTLPPLSVLAVPLASSYIVPAFPHLQKAVRAAGPGAQAHVGQRNLLGVVIEIERHREAA